jgi:hypothetical protein
MSNIQTKHIPTMGEYVAMKKAAQRPDATTSNNGELSRPSLESIAKAANDRPPVRMGRGVDPHSVVEQDLEEYERWKYGNRV